MLIGLGEAPMHCCTELAHAIATGHTLHLRVLRGETERDVRIIEMSGDRP